jgi:hypothetical protein
MIASNNSFTTISSTNILLDCAKQGTTACELRSTCNQQFAKFLVDEIVTDYH